MDEQPQESDEKVVNVSLDMEAFSALAVLAAKTKRSMRAQAAILLRCALMGEKDPASR